MPLKSSDGILFEVQESSTERTLFQRIPLGAQAMGLDQPHCTEMKKKCEWERR